MKILSPSEVKYACHVAAIFMQVYSVVCAVQEEEKKTIFLVICNYTSDWIFAHSLYSSEVFSIWKRKLVIARHACSM